MPSITTTHDVREFIRWTASLDYREIRQAERPQHSQFTNGHRVRGINITPTLCIARDGQFYDVSRPVAVLLAPSDVLERHTLFELKDMFRIAVQNTQLQRAFPTPSTHSA